MEDRRDLSVVKSLRPKFVGRKCRCEELGGATSSHAGAERRDRSLGRLESETGPFLDAAHGSVRRKISAIVLEPNRAIESLTALEHLDNMINSECSTSARSADGYLRQVVYPAINCYKVGADSAALPQKAAQPIRIAGYRGLCDLPCNSNVSNRPWEDAMLSISKIRLCALALLTIGTRTAISEPVRLVPSGESRIMVRVESAGNLSPSEVERGLDPEDCDPYEHIYIVGSKECRKLRSRSDRKPKYVRSTENSQLVCLLSGARYFEIKETVDMNAPCYGRDGGKLLRGEVFFF